MCSDGLYWFAILGGPGQNKDVYAPLYLTCRTRGPISNLRRNPSVGNPAAVGEDAGRDFWRLGSVVQFQNESTETVSLPPRATSVTQSEHTDQNSEPKRIFEAR